MRKPQLPHVSYVTNPQTNILPVHVKGLNNVPHLFIHITWLAD